MAENGSGAGLRFAGPRLCGERKTFIAFYPRRYAYTALMAVSVWERENRKVEGRV